MRELYKTCIYFTGLLQELSSKDPEQQINCPAKVQETDEDTISIYLCKFTNRQCKYDHY